MLNTRGRIAPADLQKRTCGMMKCDALFTNGRADGKMDP